ncbi:uncharacterized protein LOC119683469 [Teleopsis dalmanni]|uniref:uncharacterized protein LOC119683469 n=1 Tax=Teleopsis dalmanni TaxID=139649 RepID=UPI000D329DCA|nr:uncharacterized protein LOC119683469 [Teleopsis dalmanni]
MAHYDQRWLKLFTVIALIFACALTTEVEARRRSNATLTACQHLRRAEARRAKALSGPYGYTVRIPRCNKNGDFESIQCSNEKTSSDCWCVDEYGVEIPGTFNETKLNVHCEEPENCPASACRMFCQSGFARDPETGCSICRCRDPCDGLECPNDQTCQVQEVKCKSEPCPSVPTCKKARSIANYCPAGMPLAIEDSIRPFLCGLEAGKPQCPPLYKCVVETGNDYGVCCPNALNFQKPGVCPATDKIEYSERTGYMCGSPCTHDLECPHMEKCCFTKGCQFNCQKPHNVTTCNQARALSDLLAINEREGRGYAPECNDANGMFSPRQCSRNGLVCWCVDPRTGHKIEGSMGAANNVNCDGWENMISRSVGRSFSTEQCDTNICAAVCEYGFKNDHNGCPTCECAEPCEGFKCAMGSHCEVATDPLCQSGSALCASWPVCKPDLAYTNPCEIGTPLSDNATGEVMYCFDERQSRTFQPAAFFEPEPESKQARSMTNRIMCPENYKCTKLHREAESICCPLPEVTKVEEQLSQHQQTMCEYLRDFSERMEGTEEGMQLAVPPPHCTDDGSYKEQQCAMRKIKVTRAEQRKILEENTIRRMRMLLDSISTNAPRSKRDVADRLKLYRVSDDVLKVQAAAPVMTRSAKVIDMGSNRQQHLGELFEIDFKKQQPAAKKPLNDNELIEMDVEECWCVDSFGTEIPRSRSFNVSNEMCVQLREQIDCLDLTCRMGCEYGFQIDPNTRCPACQCRDPCDGVTCGDGKECRIVDVSCDEEYCPPVPACLPRKPGQCPYLVPPGSDLDTNTCAYECRTDAHCEGSQRCCSNGCGTQCVQPQMKTACQHLQGIQIHQSSELGIPAMKMHIAQCDPITGKWEEVQCAPDGYCWCVTEKGQEISGTRIKGSKPICKINSAFKCEILNCESECESGYRVDENGCQTCECRDYCNEINCSSDEECQLINIECVDAPCPKMPICVPKRDSICPEGNPLKQGDTEVSCGPHNENEICPTTHTCQLNPVSNRGVCCTKTRDVCFESMDNICLSTGTSLRNSTRYRFSPKANKCIAVDIDLDVSLCQTKNLFHNKLACNSVCPVLTQCERLKLKNRLAAQRTGHSSVWFQPSCDPVTGNWSPVQCLGKQPALDSPLQKHHVEGMSRAFGSERNVTIMSDIQSPYGVCWCADKKGAPLKGTLTRDIEPTCNSRQGRAQREYTEGERLMEDLITHMTSIDEIDNVLDLVEASREAQQEEREKAARSKHLEPDNEAVESTKESIAVTERVLELSNSLLDSKLSVETMKPLQVNSTRCHEFAKTATYPITCDDQGGFMPTQCDDTLCWCVDEAGNPLNTTSTFPKGRGRCLKTPIHSVDVELHMHKETEENPRDLYEKVRAELIEMLGTKMENLRVHENVEGKSVVRFQLNDGNKLHVAHSLESAIASGNFHLVGGHLQTNSNNSHFTYHSRVSMVGTPILSTENNMQYIIFILATGVAFLVSVSIVYLMLKRGSHMAFVNYMYPIRPIKSIKSSKSKAIEFATPIFVFDAQKGNDSSKSNVETKELPPSVP